jgi:hypothetical protein
VLVEVAGKTTHLHALYDLGALVTHVAAEEARLERMRQPTVAVAGWNGRCTMVGFHYMVPIVDGDDRVWVLKAMGMDSIPALGATRVPVNKEKRIPQTKGCGNKLAKPAKDVELLIGMENQGWMPWHIGHIGSSQVEGDNLRLIQSLLGQACILMGSTRMTDPGEGIQGTAEDQAEEASAPDKTSV